MKLLENISCQKGIALNPQLVELLMIIDDNENQEIQDKMIDEYLSTLEKRQKTYFEAKSKKDGSDVIFVLKEVLNSIQGLSNEQRKTLFDLYQSSFDGMKICDNEHMRRLLENNGFDTRINTEIMKQFRNIDFTAKEGILELTPEKVRKLYQHMFENGNSYNRVTFDNAGKFSSYVSIDGQTYADEKFLKMMGFCNKHGMNKKINTLMFYADFPANRYGALLDSQIQSGEIPDNYKVLNNGGEQYKRDKIKQILCNYVIDISTKFKGEAGDAIDIFNEFVYDSRIIEKTFDGEDIFNEEQDQMQEMIKPYHERKKGWQEYISLEDLCEIALEARKRNPKVTFTYNDENWIIPEKRTEIIQMVKKIQAIEKKLRDEKRLGENERLIDTIGFQAHLNTNVDLEEIDRVFDDIKKELGLPVEITELDVASYAEEPKSEIEVLKQAMVLKKIMTIAQDRPDELISLTIWSQSDECCFLNEKHGSKVYASLLDSYFQEKDIPENLRERIQQIIASSGKSGLEDCMQDDKVKMSTTQMATRVVRNSALGRDENSREEENNIGD